ncbi:hypothetical protein BJF78_26110 [Pseudonocardia sp. CNS-139]|nr:hypothetical protein BJF78_26110 [Pseudonocardia sp. CNS-139]
MDPLSHVLSLLNVDEAVSAPLLAGGDWAVDFPGHPHIKFAAVVEGSGVLTVSGAPEPVQVKEGDCFLVVGRLPYRLASGPHVPAVPAHTVYRHVVDGFARVGGPPDTTFVGGSFTFDPATAPLLLDVLPPMVHVPSGSEHAEALRATLALVAHEVRATRLGAPLMLDRLAHVVLLHALRAHAAAEAARPAPGGGWLVAALDPQIGPALRALHGDPARAWTVAELAALARMSRSTFALRFKAAVGASPLDHLLRLRMHAAAAALRDTDRTVAAVAAAVGYGSESAFGAAFKRVMGTPPGDYRTALSSAHALRR